MINFITETYPDLTPIELEWCYTAEWLGLKKTVLKKDLKSEGSKSSWLNSKDILLLIILDYIYDNLPLKSYNVSLYYDYEDAVKNVFLKYREEDKVSFESLQQAKDMVLRS